MAASTAAVLAAAAAVGLYGAQVEQAKQLEKDIAGATPEIRERIEGFKRTMSRQNSEIEDLTAKLRKSEQEKSAALAKLTNEERARQAMTKKLVANSPAEEAFRKASGPILTKAAEIIIEATNPSERVANVLKTPASSVFRRGTLQQLYQLVLQAEGMSEADAAARAVPEAPLFPRMQQPLPETAEEADGGIPEEADGGIPEPEDASDPGSRRSSGVAVTPAPAAAAPAPAPAPAPAAMAAILTPETQAILRAADDAEMAVDDVEMEARRTALPGTDINTLPEVIQAREAATAAREAANKAIGKGPLPPPTSGLGAQTGGARLAATYEDFAKMWLDAITTAGSQAVLQKETSVATAAQAKRDKEAAEAATLFNASLEKAVQKIEADLRALPPPPVGSDMQLALGKATYLLGKTKSITTEAGWNEVKADPEWEAGIKERVKAEFDKYRTASAPPKVPLSQRLGIVRPPKVAPAPAAVVAPEPPAVAAPAVVAPEPPVVVPEAPAPAPAVVVPEPPAPAPAVVVPEVPAPAPAVVVPEPPAPAPKFKFSLPKLEAPKFKFSFPKFGGPAAAAAVAAPAAEAPVVPEAPAVAAPAVAAPVAPAAAPAPVIAAPLPTLSRLEQAEADLRDLENQYVQNVDAQATLHSEGKDIPASLQRRERALEQQISMLRNRVRILKRTQALAARVGRQAPASAAAPARPGFGEILEGELRGAEESAKKLTDFIESYRAKGKAVPKKLLDQEEVYKQRIASKRAEIANLGMVPEEDRRKLSMAEQRAALAAEPLSKPSLPRTRRTSFGGARKRTLKKRRGVNKRNGRGSRRS